MSGPASEYAEIVAEVATLIERQTYASDPPVRAYMVVRAALVWVRGRHGDERVAEMASRLADQASQGKL